MTCPHCAVRGLEQFMLAVATLDGSWFIAQCFGCGHTVRVPPEPQW